jgi:hypothetical protein
MIINYHRSHAAKEPRRTLTSCIILSLLFIYFSSLFIIAAMRQKSLDAYLQAVLVRPALARCEDVREFLGLPSFF